MSDRRASLYQVSDFYRKHQEMEQKMSVRINEWEEKYRRGDAPLKKVQDRYKTIVRGSA